MVDLDAIYAMDGRTFRERLPVSEADLIRSAERARQWRIQAGCAEADARQALGFLRGWRKDTRGLPISLRAFLAALEPEDYHAEVMATRSVGLGAVARRWIGIGRALLTAVG